MFIYLEIATKLPYHTLKGKEKVCVQRVIKTSSSGRSEDYRDLQKDD